MNDFDPFDTAKFQAGQEKISFENIVEEPYKTGINDIESDAQYRKGIDSSPIFNVEKDEFFNNNTAKRHELKFSTDKVQKYLDSSRNSPFFVRYKDDKGQQFIRKVK